MPFVRLYNDPGPDPVDSLPASNHWQLLLKNTARVWCVAFPRVCGHCTFGMTGRIRGSHLLEGFFLFCFLSSFLRVPVKD